MLIYCSGLLSFTTVVFNPVIYDQVSQQKQIVDLYFFLDSVMILNLQLVCE